MNLRPQGLNVRQRGRRTNECLDVLRRLWTEEHVSFKGRHFQLDDVTINPRPTQTPHPPVWVAGRRDAAMLRAVRHGDGWLPYFFSPERYRDSVAKINDMAAQEGRDLAGFDWVFFPYISIYPTVEEAVSVAAEALGGRYLYGETSWILLGTTACWTGGAVHIQVARIYRSRGPQIVFSVTCPPGGPGCAILRRSPREIVPHFRAMNR